MVFSVIAGIVVRRVVGGGGRFLLPVVEVVVWGDGKGGYVGIR